MSTDIRIRPGTGNIYNKSTTSDSTDVNTLTTNYSESTCQDCLNKIQIGAVGSGASLFSRRENNLFLFKSIEVDSGLTLITDGNSIKLGSTLSLPLEDLLARPGDFTGNEGKVIAVNSEGTALEYVDASSGGGSSSFVGLTDTPSSYTGAAGKYLKVNSAGTGVEFATGTSGGSLANYTMEINYDSDGNISGTATLPSGWTVDAFDKTHITITKNVSGMLKHVGVWGLETSTGNLQYRGVAATTFDIDFDPANPNTFVIFIGSPAYVGTGPNGKVVIQVII